MKEIKLLIEETQQNIAELEKEKNKLLANRDSIKLVLSRLGQVEIELWKLEGEERVLRKLLGNKRKIEINLN